MNTSKNKVTNPPPKFHDFTTCEASDKSNLSSSAIWEVGVPAQHSLYWSIVLSYLHLSNDSDFEKYLQKITGDDEEVDQIKQKRNLGSEPLDTEVIKNQLKILNPFKNRHASFNQGKEVEKVFRIFKLRLNRYANELRKKHDEWNDDFKLNAASLLLECEIEVHFPDETADQKIEIYPKSPHEFNTRIILFPAQHNLYRSIVLSYLDLSNDSDFEKYLQKITGDDKEVDQIKQKKNLGSEPLNTEVIKQQLKSFNLFKNSHASFNETKEVEKVFRIFKLRLNRYANELRKEHDEWNDDFKLNAASLLLECEIEVHFPDETADQKIEIYPKSPHEFNTRIILFPAQHNLYRSIVLSYLDLSNDSDFEKYLQKITGDDKEVDQIQQERNLDLEPLDTEVIKKQLESFNPFKNRHASFIQAKEVAKVCRIFKQRLNRYTNELRKEHDEWNDDFKLNAASLLLECEIEVHFPDETADQKIEIYPKSPHEFNTSIILFQYENQQHGSRSENINVFRFGMPDDQAISRKIDALTHFLKIAKISGDFIVKVRKLMVKSENHGKSFLTTILKSECSDILQEIYRSPYTAVKISEAGFETDPLACSATKLSVFCQSVLFSKCSKNLYILYDYASNCRSLFDHSVRRASDNVLESIKKIKSVLEKDVSELSTDENSKTSNTIQISLSILKQFITHAEYQIKVASDLNNLKKNFESSTKTEMDKFKFRKSVIESILTHYQNYSYCNLDRQLFHTLTISDKFSNYLRYSDYYKNVDSFGCISFFDNFYQLRLLIGLKQENVFLNIEWKMFAVILFNNYFSERDLGTEDNLAFDEKKCKDVNVLRYVPLLHRNVLQAEILAFLEKLESSSDSESLQKSLKSRGSRNDLNALPQVIDVLLKIRIERHIQAALEVSPGDDGIKSILVIERALQVVGESIKTPSVSNSIISFLLRSCLSANLQNHLKFIRNDLSHERCNSAYGRLKTEQDFDFFRKMQKEIAQIKRHFEIVFFTQSLRIEESAMASCINEIGAKLAQDVRKAFFNEYKLQVDERIKIYEEHHGKCVELLFDILSDLQNRVGKAEKKEIMGQLKAANYLLSFICRHTTSVTVLNNLEIAADFFVSGSENKEKDLFENELRSFLSKWIRVLQQNNIIGQRPLSAPVIESFFTLLKSDLFSIDEESQIKTAIEQAYEEAIDANNSLMILFTDTSSEIENFEIWLKRIFIPLDKIASMKNYFENKEFAKALSLIKSVRFSKKQLKKDLEEMFHSKSGTSSYFMVLLTKITYQKYLSSPIYTSEILSDHILEKLEFFLTKTVHILIARMKSLKNILIDEDGEIQNAWIWGKSKAMKHHMKFLMRQRYMRDVTVRASLDMAFFDCVNILHKPVLSDLYEKSTDLFSGIDLRNVLAHRTNIPETIGGILDEDDFPSTMIEKMLELIDDLDAVESIFELFPKVGILEEEDFVDWINNGSADTFKKEIKAIRECERWDRYLFLFPFIKC